MPVISDYFELIKFLLGEAGKYFALLLLAVLALRFWRRLPKLSGAAWRTNVLLASLVTLLAAGTGYFSVCHSLSRMYFHFGMQAIRAGRLDPAYALFDESWRYRHSPDALGAKGVCLLVAGHADVALPLLASAKAMRHGQETFFESFYEGLYYFYANQVTNATPLLEYASCDPDYGWEVTKLFAVVELDRDQPQEALRIMKPFLETPITEPEHAYVMARLRLRDGKVAEAKALVDKFLATDLTPYWRKRFQQLQTTIQNEKTAT